MRQAIGRALPRSAELKPAERGWLDGIVAGGGLAAIGAVIIVSPVLASASRSAATTATALVYPDGDLILVGLSWA